MSVIDKIVSATEATIRRRQQSVPLADLQRMVLDAPPVRKLSEALSGGFSVIAEIKEKSPSLGLMDERNVAEAPAVYETWPTIAAISVVTEEHFFGGSLRRLQAIRNASKKPVLRKDFILDEYQVWEARAFGADAILLMASLAPFARDAGRLRHLHAAALDLGMEVLCEIGMAGRWEAPRKIAERVPKDAAIWGANSREFTGSRLRLRARASKLLGRDLTTDLERHAKLRDLIPANKLAVAESGVHLPSELDTLVRLRYDAALIGTAFLKGPARVCDVARDFATRVDQLRSQRQSVPVVVQDAPDVRAMVALQPGAN